ncbi:MAG: ABC transporter permease [Alphaproteobacteria bacterium]|nr:ABC transporter permease [Alphaproteobacteria bacterium]
MRFPFLLQLLSVALFAALWEAAALAADSRLLPGPAAVLGVLGQGLGDGELPYHVAITLARVAASFVIAMVVGTAIGIAMGRLKTLDRVLDSWLVLFLNIPALVTIILAYVWFGLIEAAAIAAVAVNKIPIVVVILREGARALERDYLEMAAVFRLGRWRLLRHVVLPQLFPFLVTAARTGLALVWKIVLVVELLGRGYGVGFQLYLSFQLFDITTVLAYTIAFIAVIQAIELGLLQPLERRAARWRR